MAGDKCLQPELNLVFGSEHGNGKCGVCGRLTFWRHGLTPVDVILDNFSSSLCFERHKLISDDGGIGYEVGVGIKFGTRSGNDFIFDNGVIMGFEIRLDKDGFESGL